MSIIIVFLFLIGILSLGLFVRLIPYIRFQFPGGYDIFYHLGRIRDPTYPQDAEIEEMKYYPSWMHDIYRKLTNSFSRISEYQLLRLHIVWDLLNGLFFWFVVNTFYNSYIALLATMLFIFTPILVKQADTLTPRPIGHFWFNFALFFGFLKVPFSFLSVIGIIMSVRCHRLSFQTILVVFLILGVFFNPIFLLNVILGIILGLLIYKNHFKMLIKSHYSIIVKFAKGSHLPNNRYLTPLFVPHIIIAIPVAFEIFWTNLANQNILKKILSLGFELGEKSSIDIFFTFWIVGVLGLVVFYTFGESVRHLVLLVAPSSILVIDFLVRLNFEFLLIPLLFLDFLAIFILLRSSSSNEDLIEIGKYIASSIKEPVLCATSSRRPIDYYTERINYSFDTSKMLSDELFTRLEELNITFLVVPIKIQIPKTRDILNRKNWKLIKVESKLA